MTGRDLPGVEADSSRRPGGLRVDVSRRRILRIALKTVWRDVPASDRREIDEMLEELKRAA